MASAKKLTPSEFALIHELRLEEADKPIKFPRSVTILFGFRLGDFDKQPVTNMIKAALLAREQDGSIRLEIQSAEWRPIDEAGLLMVVPTGNSADWPPATMESRLLLDRKGAVADIAFDWLGDDSPAPWAYAAEKGMIMLALRGLAVVQLGWWGRTYAMVRSAPALLPQDSPQVTESLFAPCREYRPSMWRLLEVEIEEAVQRRTLNDETNRPSPDPWDAEAATDRERFLERSHVVTAKSKGGVLLALLGVGLAFLTGWIAHKQDLIAFTLVVAGYFAMGGGILAVQPKLLGSVVRTISARAVAQFPSLSERPSPTLWDSVVGLVFLVPLATLVTLLGASTIARSLLWPGVGAAMLFTVYYLLRERVSERIDEVVKNDSGELSGRSNSRLNASAAVPCVSVPATAQPNGDRSAALAPPDVRAADSPRGSARGGEPPLGVSAAQFFLDIISPDAIPPTSADSKARVDAIQKRAPAIRSVYRKGIAFLAVTTTMLAVAYWLVGPAPLLFSDGGVQFSERTPWFMGAALLATLMLLSPSAPAWIGRVGIGLLLGALLRGSTVTLPPNDYDETSGSIRPLALRLLGAFWVVLALLRAAIVYPSFAPPAPMIIVPITIISVLAYLYWVRRGRASVERLYPYHPPLNLLALRVFGSGNLRDFLNLSDAWQWLGTRQLLDGPDTSGRKVRDLVHFLAGRIDRSIVEDAAELREALDVFSARPDRKLRFPVNSMQCSNATWQEALQHLLDQADVVVMDLSGLSEQNRGVAYELEKLINEIALNRVVLLFDDSTDLKVLRDILAHAFENVAGDSPNRLETEIRVRMFDMGGATARKADESAYDWKRRTRARMNERQLVELLFDAAQPARAAAAINPKRDRMVIQWSRLAIPRWLGWVVNVVWWTFLLSAATVSVYRLGFAVGPTSYGLARGGLLDGAVRLTDR
jgi:hypothetical protein